MSDSRDKLAHLSTLHFWLSFYYLCAGSNEIYLLINKWRFSEKEFLSQ